MWIYVKQNNCNIPLSTESHALTAALNTKLM